MPLLCRIVVVGLLKKRWYFFFFAKGVYESIGPKPCVWKAPPLQRGFLRFGERPNAAGCVWGIKKNSHICLFDVVDLVVEVNEMKRFEI